MDKKFEYGDRLKELRGDKSMDELVDEFSKYANIKINKSMISRWENGLAVPDQKQIIAYAKHFNVDMNYLLGLVNVKSNLNDTVNVINSNELYELLKNIDKTRQDIILKIISKLTKLDIDTLKSYDIIIK